MNGKGSKPRPLSVPRDEFARRWEETFGNTHEELSDDYKGAENLVADMRNLFCGEPAILAPGVGFLTGRAAKEWLRENLHVKA